MTSHDEYAYPPLPAGLNVRQKLTVITIFLAFCLAASLTAGPARAAQILQAVADGHVYAYSYRNWDQANLGGYGQLEVGWHPQGGEKRTFIRFELPQMPQVEKALLRLYISGFYQKAPPKLSVYMVATPWKEGRGTYHSGQVEKIAAHGELSWRLQPRMTGNGLSVRPPQKVNTWLTVDITSFVNAWLRGRPNYGLAILSNGPRHEQSGLVFHSREYQEHGKRPQLVLFTHNAPPVGGGPVPNAGGDGGNMIVNPSFEQGRPTSRFITLAPGSRDLPGWRITQPTIDVVQNYWRSSDGKRSLDINGTPGLGGIAQTVPTIPGRRYTVHFDMAGNPDCGPLPMTLLVSAGNNRATYTFNTKGHTSRNMGWVQKSFSFVAQGNHTTLSFVSLSKANPSCGPALDNVRMTPAAGGGPTPPGNGGPGMKPPLTPPPGGGDSDAIHFSCAAKQNDSKGCCCFKGSHTYQFEPRKVGKLKVRFDTGRKLNCLSQVAIEVRAGGQWKKVHSVNAVSSKGGNEKAPMQVTIPLNQLIDGVRLGDGCRCCIDSSEIWLLEAGPVQPGGGVSIQPIRLYSGTFRVGVRAGDKTYLSAWTLNVSGRNITGHSKWNCCPRPRTDPLKGYYEGDQVIIERDCTGQGTDQPCHQVYTARISGKTARGTWTHNGRPAGSWILYLKTSPPDIPNAPATPPAPVVREIKPPAAASRVPERTESARPQPEPPDRNKVSYKALVLRDEGKHLEESGSIKKAIKKYEESLKLSPDAELQNHVDDLKAFLKDTQKDR